MLTSNSIALRRRVLGEVEDFLLTLADVCMLLVVDFDGALDHGEGEAAEQRPLELRRHVLVQPRAEKSGHRREQQGTAKDPRHRDGIVEWREGRLDSIFRLVGEHGQDRPQNWSLGHGCPQHLQGLNKKVVKLGKTKLSITNLPLLPNGSSVL